MRSKAIPYVLLLVMAIFTFFLTRWKKSRYGTSPKTETVSTKSQKNKSSRDVNRNSGFDRRISYIEYTEHAKCRMDCRHITQKEVEQIMKEGKINYTKSDVKQTPCPTYALEGMTEDDQKVRIVFVQCDYKSKVVTVIDLKTEWECHCPGYEQKYKNQT